MPTIRTQSCLVLNSIIVNHQSYQPYHWIMHLVCDQNVKLKTCILPYNQTILGLTNIDILSPQVPDLSSDQSPQWSQMSHFSSSGMHRPFAHLNSSSEHSPVTFHTQVYTNMMKVIPTYWKEEHNYHRRRQYFSLSGGHVAVVWFCLQVQNNRAVSLFIP